MQRLPLGARLRVTLAGRIPAGPALRQLRFSLATLLLVVGTGVAGYVAIADFSPFDALYQTVLTVTTIGFEEIHPLDRDGRIFTIVLSILGVGAVVYVVGSAAALVIEGELKRDLEAWRMTKRIDALRDHVIVCGAGRVGREVAGELAARKHPFVVVDPDPAAFEACEGGWFVLQGDASSNDVLSRAGIDRARGLIVATQNDAENTFIVLTAKGMREDLYIVARSAQPQSEAKLIQAGADRIISPTQLAGRRMAVATLHPALVDFAETVLHSDEASPVLAQLDIAAASHWDGVTIADAFGQRTIGVLGVRDPEGRLNVGPHGTERLRAGSALMVYGPPEEIEALSAFAGPPPGEAGAEKPPPD